MPADIYVDEGGVERVVSLRKSMWHSMGRVVNQEMTDEQLEEYAGWKYEVVKDPLFSLEQRTGGNGVVVNQHEQVAGWKLLRRSDTGAVFGCVSDAFRPFQNREMIQLMRRISGGTELVWETAGALGARGQTVWCQARLPALQIALGNDKTEMYMLLANGHGNQRALTAKPTPVRTICANTMASAMVGKRERIRNTEGRDYSVPALNIGYSINHTRGLDEAVNAIAAAYSRCVESAQETKKQFDRLASVKLTASEAADYWEQVFKLEAASDETDRSKTMRENREVERRRQLDLIWASGTNKGLDTEDTLFTAYQAAIEYVDHVAPARSDATRFTRSQFGEGVGVKQQAWELAFSHLGG